MTVRVCDVHLSLWTVVLPPTLPWMSGMGGKGWRARALPEGEGPCSVTHGPSSQAFFSTSGDYVPGVRGSATSLLRTFSQDFFAPCHPARRAPFSASSLRRAL